jgi:hypothetical protein
MEKVRQYRKDRGLTQEVVDALKEILKKYTGYVSAKDIIFLMNQKLPHEARLEFETFRQLVAGKAISLSTLDSAIYEEFLDVYLTYQIDRKYGMVKDLEKGTKAWQRYAWLLERIDPETYALTFKHEVTGKDGSDLYNNKTDEELRAEIDRLKSSNKLTD